MTMQIHTCLPHFACMDAAWAWLDQRVDDPCTDNYRVGVADCAISMAEYEARADQGCCGSADRQVVVDGVQLWIGCNYGH